MKTNWTRSVLSLGAALAAMASMAWGAGNDRNSIIGAEVVGSGGYSKLGTIVGVARSDPSGPAQLYVVKRTGFFGGRGVIPLSHVEDEMPVPRKDGSTGYRVEVSINKATFNNIANWDKEESLSSYLERLDSILGTVYGLQPVTLDGFARTLVVDYGSADRESQSSVAGL